MPRITGLDLAKTLIILLLFLIHSPFSGLYGHYWFFTQYFFLGTFMYISGYLAYISLSHESKKTFIKKKLQTIYIPYAFAVVFYHLVEPSWRLPNPFLVDLLGGNVLESTQAVSLHLWFIPTILLFLFIVAVLHGRRTRTIIAVVSVFYLSQIGMEMLGLSPIRLFWRSLVVIWPFLAGYLAHKNKNIQYYMLMVFGVLATFLNPQPLQYSSADIALTLSGVLGFMTLMFAIKKQHRKIDKITKTIADAILYIYLAEPFISDSLTTLFPLMDWTALMFVRVLVTFAVGIALQRIADMGSKLIRWLRTPKLH